MGKLLIEFANPPAPRASEIAEGLQLHRSVSRLGLFDGRLCVPYRQQAAPATSKSETQETPASQKAEEGTEGTEGTAPTSL